MCDQLENLAQLAYSKFAGHYSRRNWLCNELPWIQLADKDKQFWKMFVQGIRDEFETDPTKEQPKISNETKTSSS